MSHAVHGLLSHGPLGATSGRFVWTFPTRTTLGHFSRRVKRRHIKSAAPSGASKSMYGDPSESIGWITVRISPAGAAFLAVAAALHYNCFSRIIALSADYRRDTDGQFSRRSRIDVEIIKFGGGVWNLFGFFRTLRVILKGEKTGMCFI